MVYRSVLQVLILQFSPRNATFHTHFQTWRLKLMEFEEVYSVVGKICTRFGTKQLKPIPIWGDTYLYERGGGGEVIYLPIISSEAQVASPRHTRVIWLCALFRLRGCNWYVIFGADTVAWSYQEPKGSILSPGRTWSKIGLLKCIIVLSLLHTCYECMQLRPARLTREHCKEFTIQWNRSI